MVTRSVSKERAADDFLADALQLIQCISGLMSMPIEFNCQACRQWLSTPDGSAGRQCQCPDCGTLLTIPATSTIAPSSADTPDRSGQASASTQQPASSLRAQMPAIEPSTNSLKIPCPRCRFELVCSPSLLGTKGQCRNCQHIFTIASKDTTQPASSQSDAPDLVFHCPSCEQLFAGQAEMEGKKGKCHACGQVFAIALEPAPATSPSPRVPNPYIPPASVPRPSVKPSSIPSPTASPSASAVVISSAQQLAPIQFHCKQCSGVMEVPASTSGQQTLCPYCGESLTIPAMSAGQRAAAPLPVVTAVTPAATTSALASPAEQNMWTALSDKNSAAQNNPYAAPSLSQHDTASSDTWNAPKRRKRLRGLSFSNAFELTFDSLFPFCLIAPMLFGFTTVITLIAYMLLIFFTKQSVRILELTDVTSITVLVYGMLACAVLVGVFAAAAAYCMTCNTALHVVRGKRISSRVVFNPGDAYGGMLAIMLGWTALNVLRTIGIPLLIQEFAKTGDPQTARLIGILTILALLLVQIVFTFLWSFVPYALLDGQSLPEAMGTSTSICFNHLFIVLPTMICGWLLYILVGVVSIGLGLVLMFGALFYLNAAIYHLAED